MAERWTVTLIRKDVSIVAVSIPVTKTIQPVTNPNLKEGMFRIVRPVEHKIQGKREKKRKKKESKRSSKGLVRPDSVWKSPSTELSAMIRHIRLSSVTTV